MKGLLAFVLVFVLAVAGLCVVEVEEQQREIDSFQQEIARQQRRMTNGTVVAANRLLRIQEFRRMTSVPYGVVVGDDFFWVKPLYPREGGVYIRLSRSNKETLRRFSDRKLVGVIYYPFRYVSLYSPPTKRSNACKDSISGAFTFEAPEILILTFAKEEVDEDGPYVDYENALLVGGPFDRLIGVVDWAGRSFFRLDEVCDGRGCENRWRYWHARQIHRHANDLPYFAEG